MASRKARLNSVKLSGDSGRSLSRRSSASPAGTAPETSASWRKNSPVRCWPASRECSSACSARPSMLGPAPAAVRDLDTDGVPDMDERGVIAGLLEQGERCQRQPLELVRRAFAEIRAVVRRHRTGERFAGRIALGGGALGRVFKVQRGLTSIVDEGGLGQVDLEQDVEPQGPCEVQRSLEESPRCRTVFPPERAAAGGGEPVSCPCSQLVCRFPELSAIANGLLEVVAGDLVQLDQSTALLQPAGVALVQLGPHALGQGLVGGVADQQVAEAEAVLALELGPVGTDELAPDERRESRRHLWLRRCEHLNRPAMEELALDRTSSEDVSLRLVQLVESSCQQRLQGGRYLHVRPVARDLQHLGDEERVAAGGVCDPVPQRRVHLVADQLVGLVVAQRLEAQHSRPGGAALQHLRTRHAEKEERRGDEQGRRFDEVEEGLLAPLDVVEDDHQRRLLFEQLAERPGDLVCARPLLALTEQRADRRCRGRVGRQRIELLDHLDHGPIGDPLAVWETAATDDPHVERGQRFRNKPRLADPRVADHGDELALSGHGALPRLPDEPQFAVAADEARLVRSAPVPRAPTRAGVLQPARPCLSAGAAQPLRSRPHRGRARGWPRRSGSRRGRRRSAGGRRH